MKWFNGIKVGKLKVLAVTSAKRSPLLPNVESGRGSRSRIAVGVV